MAKIPKGAVVEEQAARQPIPADAQVEEEKPLEEPPSRLSRVASALRKAHDAVASAPLNLLLNPSAELSPQGGTGAALRGFGHGASYGFTDELRGAAGALDEATARLSPFKSRSIEQTRPSQGPLDAISGRYLADRDAARHEEDQSAEAQPVLHTAGEVGGMVATPNPFSKLGAGIKAAEGAGRVARFAAGAGRLGGRLAGAAGQGEIYGAGSSRANDVGGVIQDVEKGGGIGLAAAAAAEPLRAGASWAAALKSRGASAQAKKVFESQADLVDSKGASLGGEISSNMRQFEHVERTISDPTASPADVAEAMRISKEPWFLELKSQVRQAAFGRLQSAKPRLEHTQALLEDAQRGMEPEALAAKTKSDLDRSVLVNDVFPRAERYAQRVVPGAIGSAVGGPIGAGAGALGGAAIGAPGTSLANLLKTPTFQHRAGQIGEAIAKPLAGGADVAGKSLLQQYLNQPAKDDEKRQEEAAANLTRKMGGR